MSDRVLVPWQESRELAGDVSGAGLRVEVFSGDEPGPEDLKDVVFYTVPYDRPHGSEPLGRMPNLRVVQALTAGYEHLVDQVPAGDHAGQRAGPARLQHRRAGPGPAAGGPAGAAALGAGPGRAPLGA